jgi:hypothetical protein
MQTKNISKTNKRSAARKLRNTDADSDFTCKQKHFKLFPTSTTVGRRGATVAIFQFEMQYTNNQLNKHAEDTV